MEEVVKPWKDKVLKIKPKTLITSRTPYLIWTNYPKESSIYASVDPPLKFLCSYMNGWMAIEKSRQFAFAVSDPIAIEWLDGYILYYIRELRSILI